MNYKLPELFQDHYLYHSKLQQDYFITIKSGITDYGQYKQALRELHMRYKNLKNLKCERELLVIDIEELKHTIETCIDKFEVSRARVKLVQKEMALEDFDFTVSETQREFTRFYQQACVLKEIIGEITDEKRDILEKEMWTAYFKRQSAIDLISHGRISSTTAEAISALPCDMRDGILELLRPDNQGQLIKWFQSQDNNSFQDIKNIDLDVKNLIEQA